MFLLEVQLVKPPVFLNNKPVYVTAILNLPLFPETCVLMFNQSVVDAVKTAMEQHYFDRPGLTPAECASTGIVSFGLRLKNAWTYCPILGMMGSRIYLSPTHFLGYMFEFVLGKSPRVPLHVEVEILHGEDFEREMAIHRGNATKRQLDDDNAHASRPKKDAQKPRLEAPFEGSDIPDPSDEQGEDEDTENNGEFRVYEDSE